MTPFEESVLDAMRFNARASHSEIARRVGAKIHQVRHAVDKLKTESAIAFEAVINPNLIGYQVWEIWAICALSGAAKISAVIKCLSKISEFVSIRNCAGQYTLMIEIAIARREQLDEILNSLRQNFENCFIELSAVQQEQCTLFGQASVRARPPIKLAPIEESIASACDAEDLKILRILRHSPLSTAESIAKKVRMPASTINYRLNRLSEKGILVGWHYLLNTEVVRRKEFTLLFAFDLWNADLFSALSELARTERAITKIVKYGGGAWTIGLRIEVNSESELVRVPFEILTRLRIEAKQFGIAEMGRRANVTR